MIECDIKGRKFYALVVGVHSTLSERGLLISPITPGISYRNVTARQVINHWRKSGRGRSGHKTEG